MQQIELLAPAGSFEALKAAVQNGADAVYLGGVNFGARAYASNFDKEIIKEAIEYSHVRGVKVYVTINTLMKDTEIEDLMKYVKYLYNIDVDAVIVQDIGVFGLIKKLFPHLEIHGSTQMTLHNKYGVKLLKSIGLDRAVLARELTVEEIKNIYNETGMELEVFVHGALCVSYSGQCLMSSFIGGRSGNRGRCAQPCRRKYDLFNLNSGKSFKSDKAFHLSMRDLNTLEEIGKLIDAGVTSFKIEGRMKKPQYVASIVKNYRKAIDTYINSSKALQDKSIEEEMEQMFNRKFTKGYLFNTPKVEVVNIEKANNRGLYLGEVESFNKREKRLKLKLNVDIEPGDGIEVVSNSSEGIGGNIRNVYINNKLVKKASKGEIAEIEIRGTFSKGDKVYKTLNTTLMDELETTYAHNKEYKKISLYGEIKIEIGETVKLHLWDNEGNISYVESDNIVEKAINVAITKDKILNQLSKLGNTPFKLDSLNINIEDNSAIPVSLLNKLRRDAIDSLENKRKITHNRDNINDVDFSRKLKEELLMYPSYDKERNSKIKISVKVDTIDKLKSALRCKVDRIYYSDINTFKEAISLCNIQDIEIYLRTPFILRDKEYKKLKDLNSKLKFNGILAGDLGVVKFNAEKFKLPIIAESSLNVMNSYTIDYFEKLGLSGVTLSPELDIKSIQKLNLDNTLEKEVIIYGKIAVMTTEYCPLVNEKQCDHKCEECRYPKYNYNFGLKDVKNVVFPIGKDYWGRSIILNSKPLYMIDRLHDLKGINVDWLRLEFTDETNEEIEEITKLAIKSIDNFYTGEKCKQGKDYSKRLKDGFTRGHYYRGVE